MFKGFTKGPAENAGTGPLAAVQYRKTQKESLEYKRGKQTQETDSTSRSLERQNYLLKRYATQNSECNGGDRPIIQKINDAYSILSIKQYVICARFIHQNIIIWLSLTQILHQNQAASH